MWFRSISVVSETWNVIITCKSSYNRSTLSWIYCLQVSIKFDFCFIIIEYYSKFSHRTNFIFVCVCSDRFPKLRLLDFRKIRQKDRQAALELFKSKQGKELLKEIAKKAKAAAANPAAADSNNPKGKTLTVDCFSPFTFLIKKN